MNRLSVKLPSVTKIAATLAIALAPHIGAQGLKVSQPPANCDLTQRKFDNPFSDTKGYVQPRIAWHAEYAVASMGIAYAVHRVTHLPGWASAAAATIAIGVVPHVRSVLIQRRYPINPGDLAFDFWDRATPGFWVIGHRDDATRPVWKNHLISGGTWLLGYAALACYASP